MTNGQPRALPKYLHLKAGRYYFVKRDEISKKPTWVPLSRNIDEALQQHHALAGGVFKAKILEPIAPRHTLVQELRKSFAKAKDRSKTKGATYFALTFDDVLGMAMKQGWRCALTGIKFSDEKIQGAHVRPFMASIDRIKCSGGYTIDNTRLVCIAANLALSTYGEQVFGRLARGYVERTMVRKTGGRKNMKILPLELRAA